VKTKFKNMAELHAALASGAFEGKAMHVLILHDDACTGSRCVCEPEYVIEDLTPESYAAGQKAQAKWLKETSN
jgi:hypothetical protein